MSKVIPFIYKPSKPGRSASVTLTLDGTPRTLTDSAPNFNAIVKALKEGAWSALRDLIDIKAAVAKYTNGRVKIIGDDVYYDDTIINSALSARIYEIFKAGTDLKPLTNFLNNLQENPSESAREELYGFLNACNLPITEDGHFLAYKVVRNDYTDVFTGKMDNSIGAKPAQDRELCDPNRNNTCSSGLHFCSRSYIEHFKSGNNRLMVVKVNPRDVVSIPTDYNNAKGRACTYEVIEEIFDDNKEIKPNFRNTDGSVPAEHNVEVKATKADKKASASVSKTNGSGVKLTEKDVCEIRKMLKEKFSYTVIGAKFGVHRRSIERIDKGDAWKHVKCPKVVKPAVKKTKVKPKKNAKVKVKPKAKPKAKPKPKATKKR